MTPEQTLDRVRTEIAARLDGNRRCLTECERQIEMLDAATGAEHVRHKWEVEAALVRGHIACLTALQQIAGEPCQPRTPEADSLLTAICAWQIERNRPGVDADRVDALLSELRAALLIEDAFAREDST